MATYDTIIHCWNLAYKASEQANELDQLSKKLVGQGDKKNAAYARMERDHFNWCFNLFMGMAEHLEHGCSVADANQIVRAQIPHPFYGVI